MIKLVGHRGLPEVFPENTLCSLKAAIDSGADGIECDIQFSRDAKPYLLHDGVFTRVADNGLAIGSISSDVVKKISVHEPKRFGDKYDPCPITALSDVVDLLKNHPNVVLFSEIKEEALQCHSRQKISDVLAKILLPVMHQVVFISYDMDVLSIVREKTGARIGWVLKQYDEAGEICARIMQPDFMICNYTKLPANNLWSGDWQWFVYDVIDANLALQLFSSGVSWIESWDVASLSAALAGISADG